MVRQAERFMKLGAVGAGEGGKELPLCRGRLLIEGEADRVSQAAPLSRPWALQ